MMTTAPEDRIREIASLPKRTTQPATQQSVDLNPNMETTAEDRIREIAALPKRTVQPDPNPNMATLGADQYPMVEITTNTGEKVMVYSDGPLAGQDKNGNFPIQAAAPVTPSGEDNGEGDGTNVEMQDAYKRLFDEYNALGLGALVEDSKDLLMKATSIGAIPEALRNTKAYMTRFSANDARIKAGYKALSPAAYLALEDQYQEVMRRYGLPESYYTPGLYGKQEGFDKLMSSDISNTELEDRLIVAQDRVLKSNPEVLKALKDFYPDIKNGDILAYTLDPKNAIKDIQRRVTAAEIGGAALQQKGLTTSLTRAEELQRYGVDKAAATSGYSTIGGGLQRGSELASIYGESPYTQATAESEIFKLTGEQEARTQRQRVTGLEKATFGGKSGVTSGALARDRAGGI
jgi:hypothetical protein